MWISKGLAIFHYDIADVEIRILLNITVKNGMTFAHRHQGKDGVENKETLSLNDLFCCPHHSDSLNREKGFNSSFGMKASPRVQYWFKKKEREEESNIYQALIMWPHVHSQPCTMGHISPI